MEYDWRYYIYGVMTFLKYWMHLQQIKHAAGGTACSKYRLNFNFKVDGPTKYLKKSKYKYALHISTNGWRMGRSIVSSVMKNAL